MKRFLNKAEVTIKKAGKDAEAFVKEASQDIKAAVDSTVVEIATNGQLKQAQDRANNVNERLTALRGQLGPVQDQARDLLLDETASTTLDKLAIKDRIKQMRVLLLALEKQVATVSSWVAEINSKANDGTSSKSGAREACETFLGKQKADEATFTVLEKQLKDMLAAQLAALKPQAVVEEDDEEEDPIIYLIEQRSSSKAAWERLINDQYFPDTLPKDGVKDKIATLSAMVDKLIAADPDTNIESVRKAFEEDSIMRAKLAGVMAKKRSTSSVVAFSETGTVANNGAGALQVQAPPTAGTTLGANLPRLDA